MYMHGRTHTHTHMHMDTHTDTDTGTGTDRMTHKLFHVCTLSVWRFWWRSCLCFMYILCVCVALCCVGMGARVGLVIGGDQVPSGGCAESRLTAIH